MAMTMPGRRFLLLTLLLSSPLYAAESALNAACGLSEAEQGAVTHEVADTLQQASDGRVHVELSVMGPWPAMSAPVVQVLSKSLRSRVAVSLSGKSCDAGRPVVVTVWFKARALREAWVYGRNAAFDTAVSAASPHRTLIDLAALQLAEADLADSFEGQWLKQSVSADRPVLKKQLRSELLVLRDAPVVVVLEGPGLLLRTQGKALQQGGLGDRVSVLVSGAEASLATVVSGKGEVHVNAEM